MYYIFHNLIKRDFRSVILFFLFHLVLGVTLHYVFNFTSKEIPSAVSLRLSQNPSLLYLYIPSALICVYGLIFHRYKDSWQGDTEFPAALHPDNLLSFLTAILISQIFFFTLIFLYISGFENLRSSLLHPFGFLSWGLFSLQSKIIIANYLNSKNWLIRLKEKRTREWLIIIDLVFVFMMILVLIFDLQSIAKVVIFLYGFRLMRILLLIPYFEQVWRSISRGIRLTTNYVTSFLVILLVLSLSSRMLFSSEGKSFKSLSNSIYSNFQIILGNGFDMPGDSSLMQLYVFAVTLIIGIIFTSMITALITDSLLAKNSVKATEEKESLPWYNKGKEESHIFYILRLSTYLSKI